MTLKFSSASVKKWILLILAMRIKYSLSLILCVFVFIAYAQPTIKSTVKVPDNLKAFVLSGYEVIDLAMGDLNRDVYPDYIMVLRKPNEKQTSDVTEHPEKRPLLILIGRADKTYKLAGRNDKVVYCVDCGGIMGDPFQGVLIKNGYFSVEHYGGSAWRWTRIITFRYSASDKKWFLHKDGGESFHAGSPEKSETSVNTVKNFGRVLFEKFDVYKED